jgi:hypothetical protein
MVKRKVQQESSITKGQKSNDDNRSPNVKRQTDRCTWRVYRTSRIGKMVCSTPSTETLFLTVDLGRGCEPLIPSVVWRSENFTTPLELLNFENFQTTETLSNTSS